MNDMRGRGRPRRRHIDDIPEEFTHRRGRMRRGDIRTALLAVLSEGPGHGYEVIQTLEAKTGGAWRPSPGSVYPTLQLLEDEGLVRSTERDGKRVYEITDAGREEATSRTEAAGGAPWEQAARGNRRFGELRENVTQLHAAARNVATTGNAELVEKAVGIVKEARRQLYQLLAES
ncbi:MAG: PadR family transcriptional regulator [Actinobacteria bacterium]|nr:PadR family transcriptional regulator [Actinomycetota bacterium]MBV9662978.1 PadR family transcriptional regulator [Actinomycetota bacterium]